MKKLLQACLLFTLVAGVTSACAAAEKRKPCTATGVPYQTCLCLKGHSCIDLADPGVHP
ncbi:MAG TPA: hypothetical protein VGH05_05710 [Buttiauxella sp.]